MALKQDLNKWKLSKARKSCRFRSFGTLSFRVLGRKVGRVRGTAITFVLWSVKHAASISVTKASSLELAGVVVYIVLSWTT